MAAAISWSGTFHAVGARLLREYAERIGLDRAFTIHDREDFADLLNLIRHDLGYSTTEKRFPARTPALPSTRAWSTPRAASTTCSAPFPLVRRPGRAELRALFAAYVEAKQRQHVLDYDDLLLYWAHMMAEPAIAADVSSASITSWSTNIRTPTGCRPRSCWRSTPTARASPWSATMRNRSTRSAPRPCATSSTFPGQFSPRARKRSRWSTITARRSQFSRRPTP